MLSSYKGVSEVVNPRPSDEVWRIGHMLKLLSKDYCLSAMEKFRKNCYVYPVFVLFWKLETKSNRLVEWICFLKLASVIAWILILR